MNRYLLTIVAAASLAANVACTTRSVAGSTLPNRTITVAQSGNADVVGSDSTALQKAADMLRSGDTLVIAPGTYQMDASLLIPSNVTVRGTAGKTILMKSRGVESALIEDGDYGESYLSVAEPEKFHPGTGHVHGEEFESLYLKYENEGNFVRKVKAQELWKRILEIQVETSMPYIMYKDACNRKSNQQNLGTIKSSNLCTEIVEFTSPEEIAVCNLASISLPSYIDGKTKPKFNHEKLHEIVKTVTINLNRVIDVNHYPSTRNQSF